MISLILITQQTLTRELMGYLRNKLLLVSLWAIYLSFNIQHRLVFQQILKDFRLWFPDGFSIRLLKIFFPGRYREEKLNITLP